MDNYRGPDSSPGCANCPCATEGKPTKPIRGAGSLKSLAVIGEGPSSEELSQGWPFVGPSGKLLQQALNANQIDRHSIWITNAILCQRPRDDTAFSTAISCCRPRLQHELSLVAPTAIITLGASAAKAVELSVQAVSQARGTIQHSSLVPSNVPIVSAIHPAAILRGGGAGGDKKAAASAGKNKMNVDAQYVYLESDLGKAYSLAKGTSTLWEDSIELITDNKDESLAKVYHLADTASLLAIDLEWDKDGNITWLGIATVEKGLSIWWPTANDLLREILRHCGEKTTPKLFHNLQADVPKWTQQVGPLNGVFEDTMLMHHACFPGAAHDLQNVASQFLNVPPWKALRKNEEKADKRDKNRALRALTKTDKANKHNAANEASASQARERKQQRIAKHQQMNKQAQLAAMLAKMEGK